MNRRDVLRAGAAAGAGTFVGVAGCATRQTGSRFRDGFEAGIDDWTGDAAIGPEEDIADFEWAVDVSTEQAFEGDRSLRVFTEGDHDDGTAWALHPIEVESGRSYTAEVTAQYWSESESFNTLRDAVMRLGPDRPGTEQNFPSPGVNTTALGETPYGGLREPLWLADGWREYTFEWTTPTLSTDTLFVAVGVSVIWESDVTHFIDDLSVDLTPR